MVRGAVVGGAAGGVVVGGAGGGGVLVGGAGGGWVESVIVVDVAGGAGGAGTEVSIGGLTGGGLTGGGLTGGGGGVVVDSGIVVVEVVEGFGRDSSVSS